MRTHNLILWTDEMIFTRSALSEQLERYSKGWRRTFIEYDASVASVYLPAIRSIRQVIKTIDKTMKPIEETLS